MKNNLLPITRCCSVEGCKQPPRYKSGHLCNRHDIQLRRKGRITSIGFDLPGEVWKAFDSIAQTTYAVSSLGRFKSMRVGRGDRLLSPHLATEGLTGNSTSLRVGIGAPGNQKNLRCALVVAKTFLPNPTASTRVLFKDADRRNCRAENLIWERGFLQEKNQVELQKLVKAANPTALAIASYQSGDKRALDAIITEHLPQVTARVRRLVFRYRVHHIDADSIIQDTLMKAMTALRIGLWAPKKELMTWLNTIAKNLLMTRLKEAGRKVQSVCYGEGADEFDLIDGAAYREWVDRREY